MMNEKQKRVLRHISIATAEMNHADVFNYANAECRYNAAKEKLNEWQRQDPMGFDLAMRSEEADDIRQSAYQTVYSVLGK